MLVAHDLHLEAGLRTLLSGGSFSLQAGDKAGLVGPNGAGKTTLMRVLAGELQPKAGRVLHTGQIGLLSQETPLVKPEHPRVTGLERILGARRIDDLMRGIEESRLRMAEGDGGRRDGAIRRFARLHDQFESRGGYAAAAEARRLAASVGVGSADLDRPVRDLSGGQRRRIELARILFAETDILLLDEPTNHLDLDAKAWLMDFLRRYRGTLLVVSHDLPLLDQAITSVLALEHGALEEYRGNHSEFLEERDRRAEARLRRRRVQEGRIHKLEETSRRFVGTTEKMARRAKAMQTRAERLRGDLVEIGPRRKKVHVRFPPPVPSGRRPLRAAGVGKAYGDEVVFIDFDLDLERAERLIVLGLNGSGKTTLLKLLAGVVEPDLGVVEPGYRASVGYYEQEHEQIRSGTSVLDHLRAVSNQPPQVLRSLLGLFLLADKVDQDAGTLSGGEKTKLALTQLVASGHNVLLLDEPTNNLDPQAKQALLGALLEYPGAIVLVSHDTAFVEALGPDRAVFMPEGTVRYFDRSMLELVALA